MSIPNLDIIVQISEEDDTTLTLIAVQMPKMGQLIHFGGSDDLKVKDGIAILP